MLVWSFNSELSPREFILVILSKKKNYSNRYTKKKCLLLFSLVNDTQFRITTYTPEDDIGRRLKVLSFHGYSTFLTCNTSFGSPFYRNTRKLIEKRPPFKTNNIFKKSTLQSILRTKS